MSCHIYSEANPPLWGYEGHLNFTTNAWTSPNYHAYVAVTKLEFVSNILQGLDVD